MKTIPTAWAAIALAGDEQAQLAAASCQIKMGDRFEVDLASLAEVDTNWASLVSGMGDRVGRGSLWEVPVSVSVQRSGGAGKKDLVAEHEALGANLLTAALCESLLGPEIDRAELDLLARMAYGNVRYSAEETVVVLDLEPEGFSEVLGGPRYPGEELRRLRLTAKHAAWRDRQVRRLSKVEVCSLIRA